MQSWKRIDPTTRINGGYRSITVKTFSLPNGRTLTFDTFDAEGTCHVGVVAVTPDKQVIIVRQFRPGPETVMDEIPGGTVEPDEEPAKAAEREFEEETGYQPGKLESLGTVRKDAYMNAVWYYFLATDCVPSSRGQHLDDNEYVEVDLISIEEFLKNARAGRMTDTDAVFLAYDKLKELSNG